MHIVFRTDASIAIGTGHVMRCLTLASYLRERNAVVTFICREHEGNLCNLIGERGFAVIKLAANSVGIEVEDATVHATWLGVAWQDDAEQTRAAIIDAGSKPDWLIVDHYALDNRWESEVRTSVCRVMVIDDLADRKHDCDLLLDQNMVSKMQTRYVDKVPTACGMLLGSEYALLQPIYAEMHDRIPPREGEIKRILIFFGGVDRDNLTGRALAAFLTLNQPDIEVDVVIPTSSPHVASIRYQAAGHGNIHLHSDLPTLSTLMSKADLAVGAVGATSWERLCLGLPTLAVTLAENQRPIADELNQRGLLRWLGHQDEVDEVGFAQALGVLIQQGQNEDLSLRCFAAVDGEGANRVYAALTVTATTPLLVRHARLRDEITLLEWANDPTTRRNGFSSELISPATHRIWFRNKLRDLDDCHLYIVETANNIVVGQVRFERSEQAWEVHYALAPIFRGRGLGIPLLKAALLKFRADENNTLIFGQVKACNHSSRKILTPFEFETQANAVGRPWCIGICSDGGSWINASIPELLLGWLSEGHQVIWVHDAAALPACDVCFYLSYGRIVDASILGRHKNNLVVHASDLPKGRGWSPLTWQILEGKKRIPITLFEAAEAVDSGLIYKQVEMVFSGLELIDELRGAVSQATQTLCRYFMREYPGVVSTGTPQMGEPTFYVRRRPRDSRIDIDRPLREQFNLLRTVDSENYPAWFEFENKRFALKLEKLDI